MALQGGGSNGAFTWGVLDALLEDGRLQPDGLSGTSAGAMNAAVLASGYAEGGAQGARDNLASFWAAIGGIDFGALGYAMVGLFVVTWAAAAVIWRTRNIEQRWGSFVE